jgi:hypothetical protein
MLAAARRSIRRGAGFRGLGPADTIAYWNPRSTLPPAHCRGDNFDHVNEMGIIHINENLLSLALALSHNFCLVSSFTRGDWPLFVSSGANE